MFFFVSKLFGVLVLPINALVILAVMGACALFTRFAKAGRILVTAALLGLLFCGFGPVGTFLARPLEDQFPQPLAKTLHPTGIIVLGGALNPYLAAARGTPQALTNSGSRITEAVVLALRFPDARLVFSGGSGYLTGDQPDEAHYSGRVVTALGIAPSRISYEYRSRNTFENAVFTRDLVKPRAGDQWLLVTSAIHMPRAVGIFRKVGFDIVPYPVNYQTNGSSAELWQSNADASDGFVLTNWAGHEWVGLLIYRIMGMTDALFPGPR